MNIVEEFGGFYEAIKYRNYPSNFNIRPKTGEIKYDNLSSTFGEFVGFVSVFDIIKAVENYKVENSIYEEQDIVVFKTKFDKQTMKVCHSNNQNKVHVLRRGCFETVCKDEVRHATSIEKASGFREDI